MADKKRLGCLPIAIVLVFVGAWINAQFNPDEQSAPQAVTTSTESPEPLTPEESPSSEATAEPDVAIERLCKYAVSVDNASRRVIKGVFDGTAKYEDSDVIALVVRNLREAVRETPELDSQLSSQFEELARRSMAIANHIEAVEIYDDINVYLDDFTPINQAYLQYQEVGDLCGF